MEDNEFIDAFPPKATTAKGVDLASILNAFIPSAEGAVKKPLPKKVAPAPVLQKDMALAPQPTPVDPMLEMAKKEAQVSNILKGGNPNTGIKSSISTKNNASTAVTNPLFMSPQEIETQRNAIASTPEWKQQAEGLNDLEHLIALKAQREAQKTHLDLSPLGAYLDYQNTLTGHPTNLAAGLKGSPEDEPSLKEMGEIQRRRADMAKELISTLRASKVGQIVTQDGQILSGISGVAPMNTAGHSIASARLRDSEKNKFFSWADTVLKDSDKQKAGLDSLSQILKVNNPASVGRIPLKRAIGDMSGNGRVAVQEVMMETGSPAFKDKFGQMLNTWVNGTISDRNKQLLEDAMTDDIKQWGDARQNRFKQIKSRAPVYGVGEGDINMAYPQDYQEGSYSRSEKAPVKKEQDDFAKFKAMMDAHDAGKK